MPPSMLELNDTGQRVTVTKDQPFRRIDGYMVDLKYTPESQDLDRSPRRRFAFF